jgi:spore coat polysaccharide biosynthesis protein SpsF
MNALVIIQARMSSSRLPGKVLKNLNQKPLLQWMIERVQRCEEVDKIVIATSTSNDDDAISEWCNNHNIHCYRGELDNVLARFYHAATYYQADIIIRLTADCPIIDPKVIDEHIRFYRQNNYDYVSNGPEMTYPDGMGVEVFSYLTLQKVFQQATLASEKEHVTAFIYNHPKEFRLYNFKYHQDFSWIRVTVDYPEDFTLIEKLVNGLLPNNEFTLEDIINYVKKHPDMLNINNQYSPNEGYELSLLKDKFQR